MNDFWNNRSRPMGSILKMKPGTTTEPTATPPPPSTGSSSQMKIKAVGPAPTPASPPPPPPSAPKSELRSAVKLNFDHDIACGVYAGVFEYPAMTVSVNAVEFTHPLTNRTERTEHWLRTNDMLAILIRELEKAKLELTNATVRPDTPPNQRAQLIKQREEAVRRTSDLREQIACLLLSRRAYMKAEEQGITILVKPS
jgi:hypothetical protein